MENMKKKKKFADKKGAEQPRANSSRKPEKGIKSAQNAQKIKTETNNIVSQTDLSKNKDINKNNNTKSIENSVKVTKNVENTTKTNKIPQINWLNNTEIVLCEQNAHKNNIFTDLPLNLTKNEKIDLKKYEEKIKKENPLKECYRLIKCSTQPDKMVEKITKKKNSKKKDTYALGKSIKKIKLNNGFAAEKIISKDIAKNAENKKIIEKKKNINKKNNKKLIANKPNIVALQENKTQNCNITINTVNETDNLQNKHKQMVKYEINDTWNKKIFLDQLGEQNLRG
ncbi:hypothetical protein BDAP_000187 [Binucleata daphniae]